MDKLLGFTPDAEATTPGVITSCENLIPYDNGMTGAPTGAIPSGIAALASDCRGSAVVIKLDDARRLFAGTSTKMYEVSGSSWTDVSRAGNYTGGVDSRWSFAQFGNATLAANLSDTIQRSDTSGAFADVAGAPKAKIIFTVGTQVMALNTNDGTVKPNGWHCSASFDDTDWTPNVSTLCTSGQLVSAPGQITAGGRLGEYAIAYKEKAVYIGQFVDAPTVWNWQPVSDNVAGCIGQDAWCDIGGAHFFVGTDSFWVFDGTRPQPVGVGQVKQWFNDNSSPALRYKTQCVYDRQNSLVWTFFVSKNGASLDRAIVYHVSTKQWGMVTISIQAALNYIAQGTTIDGLDSIAATIDNLESYSFDSQFWLSGGRALSVFSDGQIQTLTGLTGTSSMTTGDAGDDDSVSLLTMIRLRFAPSSKPTTANVQVFGKMEEGESLVPGPTSSMDDGKFDVLQSARFHRASFTFTGGYKVIGIGAVLKLEGNR